MKENRLNLADFKLKKSNTDTDVSKLMGNVLGHCHDGQSGGGALTHAHTGPFTVPSDWDPSIRRF